MSHEGSAAEGDAQSGNPEITTEHGDDSGKEGQSGVSKQAEMQQFNVALHHFVKCGIRVKRGKRVKR